MMNVNTLILLFQKDLSRGSQSGFKKYKNETTILTNGINIKLNIVVLKETYQPTL